MLYDAVDIQALILHATWLCLSVPDWINPRFRVLFPAYDSLAALFPQLGLTFVDGLFDAVQGSSPPSVDWFLSLPDTVPTKLWGVYVLVLKKRRRYAVYIGSGSDSKKAGVRARLLQHKNRSVEPSRVRDAKNQGYKQIHAALLCHCPMPAPAHVPAFRTALVAIEAAFHLLLWPMYNRKKKYGFPPGPWSRDDYEWAGLSSHNPLTEGVIVGVDDLDFTAEQLEFMAAIALQRKREVRREWDAKQKAERSPEEHREFLDYKAVCNKRSQPKNLARGKRYVEEQRFHCSPCDKSFATRFGLDRHTATPRHQSVVDDGCGLYCEPCDYKAKDRNVLHRHQSSNRHKRRCGILD
ncbi:hypothetical protein HBH56_096970 [Parastagonospora nodorum]|nr:hypothetical protein HBH56_096970 [Parastagonospora nodorum]KAH3930154.1 hypothetical protein HBH54_111290 [Parastagonospora nodorum]KAH3945229.1 hypothetical protein HBH53_148140 [Parastagonospora nodorum]KAH3967043.1 hypothetical protein HBH51_139550 [Parastagonospora nodorum]KAH3981060.1 hypothetical protein HBH52_084730 [Parastagonospora nodorum]